MVDYNRQKIEAMNRIDELVTASKLREEDIFFVILREKGFGERFVKSYLEAGLKRGFFFKDKDNLILLKTPIFQKQKVLKELGEEKCSA